MSETIQRFKFNMLRREEQHSFNDRVLQILHNTCGTDFKVYERFEAAARTFDNQIADQTLNSVQSLASYDAVADNAWSSMNLQLKASLVHPRPSIRAAAEEVNAIFSKTPNPTNLNYDQEYGSLRTLLTQLATLPEETLKTALVDEHFKALRDAVDAFTLASIERIDALSKKQNGLLKAASNDCYKAWLDLAKYLELMLSIDELPGSGEAIDQLNILILGIKRRLSARSKSDATPSSNIVAEEIAAESAQI